jgi:hypothetical protein
MMDQENYNSQYRGDLKTGITVLNTCINIHDHNSRQDLSYFYYKIERWDSVSKYLFFKQPPENSGLYTGALLLRSLRQPEELHRE